VMQDEHLFLWVAMLETADVELAGRRVLDVGCNRGGFLRLLVDRAGIAEGFGYDPATAAVDDARRLAGGRPVHFEAAEAVPAGWGGFDVAFSHEVLYLLHDLAAHAADVFSALAPGGVYFAAMGVHTRSPLMVRWHADNALALALPKLYDLDEVVAAFAGAGFSVSLGRLALRFVPARGGHHGHDHGGALFDWVEYYAAHKLLLRFERPSVSERSAPLT
jgi:SAM-dependent methyltransferase